MEKPLFPALALLLFTTALQGQVTIAPTVLASGGGTGKTDNLTISWTVGELAVATLKSTSIILTQGFQQPFEMGVGIHKDLTDWEIEVYPNPVGDEVAIRFELQQPKQFLIEIQDVTGRLLNQLHAGVISPGDIVRLNTSAYANGVYFLKVSTSDRKQHPVFKLQKL